jgi:mono/diheme cytochrome c family protein
MRRFCRLSRWTVRLVTCSALWALVLLRSTMGAAPPAAQDVKSVWTGVYTEAQAQRGADLYGKTCARCHGKSLEGADAAALSGKDFMTSRDGTTVDKLFRKILDTMPDDDPGTLKPPQVADVTAHILSVNKFPAGEAELPADAALLKQIKIEAAKK